MNSRKWPLEISFGREGNVREQKVDKDDEKKGHVRIVGKGVAVNGKTAFIGRVSVSEKQLERFIRE